MGNNVEKLTDACLRGDIPAAESLLSKGTSVNSTNSRGFPPLFNAAQEGHTAVVELLLQRHGADMDVTNPEGATALYISAQKGHRQVVKALLQNKASVNQAETTHGATPLYVASRNGHRETVELLLQHQASVNQATTTDGCTPLYVASQKGHRETVELLFQNQAAVNQATTTDRATPLYIASQNGHRETVELLLQHQASVNQATTTERATPLYIASQEGHREVVELLLQNQASVNQAKTTGSTPLCIAAHKGHLSVVTVLLAHGASVHQAGANGTPLDIAREWGHTAVVELLIQHGASVKPKKVLASGKDNKGNAIPGEVKTVKQKIKAFFSKGKSTSQKPDVGKDIQDGEKLATQAATQTAKQEKVPKSEREPKGKTNQGSPFFHQGDSTTMKWTEAEKKMLTETSAMRVLYVGDSEAGKSSLVGTILSGDSYLAHADDRTVVAELNHWVVRDQKNDKSTFSLVDLGGHHSYLSSGHFFHCNSRNNIATLCHDVTSKNHFRSFMWLKSVLTRSPMCHIAIALTKSDLLSEQEQQEKLKLFRDKLKVHLQKEIRSLKDSIYFAEKNDSSKLSTFNELCNKYEWIIQEMEQITVLVSCKKKESVGALTDIYVQLSEKPENKVLLPVHFHTVFTRSGTLGMKIIDVETRPQPVDVPHNASDEIFPVDNGSDDIDVTQEEISVKDDKSTSELPLRANTSQKQTPIPVKTIEQKVSQYMTLEEAMEVYTDVLVFHELPASTDLKADTQRCLNYLHQHGLMMYFPVGGALENIVFNNINTFVVIMRSVFHHDLRQYLEGFNTLPVQFRSEFYGNDETRFKDDVDLLQSQGLLSEKILQILLHKSECQIEPEAVLQLLDLLEIGFSYVPEMMDTKFMFVPFFIEKKHSTEEIQAEIAQLENSDHKSLCVHSQVRGNLSLTLWHYLVVRFCKKLVHNNMQRREIWSNGFLAYVGESDAMMHLQFNGEDKIDMKVKANVTTTTGHGIIWQNIRLLSSEISDLMRDWWPGLVTSKIIFCTHCMCQQKTTDDCCEWSMDQLLDSKTSKNETCCCKKELGKQLPSALLMPLPLDATKAQVRVTALCDYLSKTFAKSPDNTELAVPHHALTQQDLMPQKIQQERTKRNLLKQTEDSFVGVEKHLYGLIANNLLNMKQLRKISTELAPCVCYIRTPRYEGTGFVIGGVKDLSNPAIQHCFILTCCHLKIKEDLGRGQLCEAVFGYYETANIPMARARIMPDIFAHDDRLDYILLALENNQLFNDYVNRCLKLSLGSLIKDSAPSLNDPLIILGHTEGREFTVDPAAYSIQRPTWDLPAAPQEYTFYQSGSNKTGASGAPCFSKDGGVLHAMHLGGQWKEPRAEADPSNSYEYGVLLWHVLSHIKAHFVHDKNQGITASYLSNEGFYQLFPNFPSC